jgi:thymidylate synthase (FAD)
MFFERAPNWRLTASATIKKHHEISLSVFEKLLEEGVCREQARGVLPQNMYTEYYGTANLTSYSRRRSMGNSTSSKCNARDNRRTLASCSFQL